MGSPVKDSQQAKVTADDHHVMACIYAPRVSVSNNRIQYWADQLASGLRQWCRTDHVESWVVS
ncbi:MAG: hypothetical protein ACQESR_05240 [Planctomycetota bacterium]